MSETHRILQPAAWPRPSGYSNGIVAKGPTVYLAGQIGWDATTGRVVEGMAAQVEQALRNIVAVLAEANVPTDRHRSIDLVRHRHGAIQTGNQSDRASYRRVMGRHFPAMSVIGVHCLVEHGALVEIEATAVTADMTTGIGSPCTSTILPATICRRTNNGPTCCCKGCTTRISSTA